MDPIKFPPKHREIVSRLLGGSFLTTSDDSFIELRDASDFYKRFFSESFDVELCLTGNFAVLEKKSENDTFSRDVVLLLGCMCNELARLERPIKASLYNDRFGMTEWIQRLESSSQQQRLLSNIPALNNDDQKRRFLNKMHKHGIISLNNHKTSWRFTEAVDWFLSWVESQDSTKLSEEN